jgi:hypothetical protein
LTASDIGVSVDLVHLSVGQTALEDESSPALAGQKEWWTNVPRLHRVLANPRGNETFCATPPNDAPHEDFLAYWLPALYLFIYSFGWTRPDLGIKWWFENGRPLEDHRMDLLRLVWDRNNQLDLLAAWLWSEPDRLSEFRARMSALCGVSIPTLVEPVDPGREWWANFHERFKNPYEDADHAAMTHDPFHGGPDPLHLSIHVTAALENPRNQPLLLRSDRASRRAVLVAGEMRGWYALLTSATTGLPDLGDRSWRVEVFCKPVGWLGTYRRSRKTGIWFSGRHRYHEVGN